MILIINTAGQDNIKLILVSSVEKFKIKELVPENKRSEKLLAAIDDFLAAQKIEPGDLKGIGVVTGPGSFTAIRIGVVVGNSLSYSLSVPAAGVTANEFKSDEDLVNIISRLLKKPLKRIGQLKPFYGKEPNIMIKNKKELIIRN